jgi:hypothetical protein
MVNICPQPGRWNEIYTCLLAVCDEREITWPPPVPLILAGWWASNDFEKADRWTATVHWAEKHGVADLVAVGPQDWYAVRAPSSHVGDPFGRPVYLRSDPVSKPSEQSVQAAFDALLVNWATVAGEIAIFTKPLRFTGAKMRRLVVAVSRSAASPPWGQWDKLANDASRRAFTDLRRKVNATIAPLAIDHIDFEIDPTTA